jgi:hypothetical protein
MEHMQEQHPTITSKEDLANFIDSFRNDFLKNPSDWENPTIDSFLDGMAAWVRSMDNYYRNMGRVPPKSPDWSTFADILKAAKVYE